MRLSVADGALTLEATDLTVGVKLTLPLTDLTPSDGAVCVRGDLLLSAAQTFSGDSLAMAQRGGQLTITGGGQTAKLAPAQRRKLLGDTETQR